MITWNARAEALGRIETELKSEMAASLGRIGRELESLINRLREMKNLQQIEEETRIEYLKVHQQAQLYFWYLMVQRESIGIRNHDSLIQLYRIPDKI